VAYGTALRAEAQELYFAGQSALKIAGELKRRYPEQCKRLSEKTVLQWISTPDPVTKETWLDKKNKALTRADEKRIDQSADLFGQLRGALAALTSTMTRRFEDAASDPSTNADYTAQVLLQVLSKQQEFLSHAATSPIGDEAGIDLFLQALMEDAELGPVFLRRREALLASYREKLDRRPA